MTRDDVKPHRKFTITREYLQKLGACKAGLAAFTRPVRISTNPEDNIAIAIRVAESDRKDDIAWLRAALIRDTQDDRLRTWIPAVWNGAAGWTDPAVWNGAAGWTDPDRDPWAMAQYLAQIADYELSKEGK